MRRVASTELLDTDNGTSDEVAASLRDLERINRWFGGVSTIRDMVRSISKQLHKPELTLLEVAAGSGYVSSTVMQELARAGIHLRVTLLDRIANHLGPTNGKPRLAGDALALPFPDNSFDLVCSNLFVHHLSPAELMCFVREALRVCRAAVAINDLVRSPFHLATVYAGFPLYTSRITRHDAPASVRQSYTPSEIRDLLNGSGGSRVEISRHYLFRMGVIVWKNAVRMGGASGV
jgi:SAM-dependent methyltransferase